MSDGVFAAGADVNQRKIRAFGARLHRYDVLIRFGTRLEFNTSVDIAGFALAVNFDLRVAALAVATGKFVGVGVFVVIRFAEVEIGTGIASGALQHLAIFLHFVGVVGENFVGRIVGEEFQGDDFKSERTSG